MRRRKVLRARRWYSAFSRDERAQLSRRRAPAPSKSAASPAATAERMPTIAPSSPSAASAIAPPANAPPVPLRSRLPSLRSSFVPPLVVSRFVSADGQSTSLRTRRTPVASSQTSQAASPATPTNSSGEPSAMARLPTPATSSRLPPAALLPPCLLSSPCWLWVVSVRRPVIAGLYDQAAPRPRPAGRPRDRARHPPQPGARALPGGGVPPPPPRAAGFRPPRRADAAT